MTEIKIEKKKPVWPWVVLALAILAALLYFFVLRDKNENSNEPVAEQTATTDLVSVHENNSTVAAYTNFAQADTNTMSLDHTYTNEALSKLSDAINAMASDAGYDVKADLEKAKQHADSITHNPYETTHADHIRAAADIFSTALQNLQQAKYPSLVNEAADVKAAAAGINPDVLTLDQRDAVKSFFRKAAGLLQKMN